MGEIRELLLGLSARLDTIERGGITSATRELDEREEERTHEASGSRRAGQRPRRDGDAAHDDDDDDYDDDDDDASSDYSFSSFDSDASDKAYLVVDPKRNKHWGAKQLAHDNDQEPHRFSQHGYQVYDDLRNSRAGADGVLGLGLRWLSPACLYMQTGVDGVADRIRSIERVLEVADGEVFEALYEIHTDLVATYNTLKGSYDIANGCRTLFEERARVQASGASAAAKRRAQYVEEALDKDDYTDSSLDKRVRQLQAEFDVEAGKQDLKRAAASGGAAAGGRYDKRGDDRRDDRPRNERRGDERRDDSRRNGKSKTQKRRDRRDKLERTDRDERESRRGRGSRDASRERRPRDDRSKRDDGDGRAKGRDGAKARDGGSERRGSNEGGDRRRESSRERGGRDGGRTSKQSSREDRGGSRDGGRRDRGSGRRQSSRWSDDDEEE